jgi:hypothetical protein
MHLKIISAITKFNFIYRGKRDVGDEHIFYISHNISLMPVEL